MKNPINGSKIRITSPYGYRSDPFGSGKSVWHGGIDIVGLDSKEIRSVESGEVLQSRIVSEPPTSQWGNYIAIGHADGTTAYYCHLSRRIAAKGQKVSEGDVIGIEGATGAVTGAHLHFEVRDRSGRQINAAEFLMIPNVTGVYEIDSQPGYASLVAERCGFEQQTVDYLNAYKYASDLWRKLWEQMDVGPGKGGVNS